MIKSPKLFYNYYIMKSKITISLDEVILSRIDSWVEKWEWKNRSQVIENILKQKFWDFVDVSAIVFAHDYKWDNRPYPFDEPKSLLKVRNKTIISRQIEIFAKTWIKNIIILIPKWTIDLFKNEIFWKFSDIYFDFIEIDSDLLTWNALKIAMNSKLITNKIIISNWDIFYWKLDLEEYYNYHKEQKSDFSFCLKFVLNPEQLWNIKIHWNRVIEFVEKPKASQMNLTNSWLYITTKNFLDKFVYWDYLEKDFFPRLPDISNTIWYIYPWEWEHIQNDSAYERINWWLI